MTSVGLLPALAALVACGPSPQHDSVQAHTSHDPATHAAHSAPAANAERLKEVERLSATVMPFDLERSRHVFTANATGGVQTVVSRDGDARQVALIRDHLREVAHRFARGDFGASETVHGAGMPGLAALSSHGGRLAVSYRDVPAGGRVDYVGRDAATIRAVSDWFAAQLSDHGRHADAR